MSIPVEQGSNDDFSGKCFLYGKSNEIWKSPDDFNKLPSRCIEQPAFFSAKRAAGKRGGDTLTRLKVSGRLGNDGIINFCYSIVTPSNDYPFERVACESLDQRIQSS